MPARLPLFLVLVLLSLPLPATARQAAPPDTPGEALAAAVKAGDLAQVRALIEAGAPVDALDWAGWTALNWAALLLETEIAAYLLDEGADIEHQAPGGRSAGRPLTLAAKKHGGAPMVTLLLERGAAVDGTDPIGRTALMRAAVHGWLDIVEVLLAHGADPNAATPGTPPITPLLLARQGGHDEVAARLIAAGAKE
ncbi:MAG: ankyrin repeat domain-containing protein [Alphaproteobacteria bacterium]